MLTQHSQCCGSPQGVTRETRGTETRDGRGRETWTEGVAREREREREKERKRERERRQRINNKIQYV